jgi:hypothetical protein
MELSGNYFLRLIFGENLEVPISNQFIKRFNIIQDMTRLLPSFRITLRDTQGGLTHLIPFDKDMSRLKVQIGRSVGSTVYNFFDFLTFRRKAQSTYTVSNDHGITGMLNAEKAFTPDYCRASNGNIKTFLETIATSELGCDSTEVSASLDKTGLLLQAQMNNAAFFDDLRCRLIGKNNELLFYIFIKVREGKKIFVCKSHNELVNESTKYKFVINDDPVKDYIPVSKYKIFDNYKILNVFGGKEQAYSYFDYYNSQFVDTSADLSNFLSLSKYFLIDGSDTEDSNSVTGLGRTNESTEDFKNEVYAAYYGRVANSVKMWITTWGIPNICPGDRVEILFPQGTSAGALASYQYNGYWLVERIVHSFGATHTMNVLLSSNGVTTDTATTLMPAIQKV